jgi:hypothetical protein
MIVAPGARFGLVLALVLVQCEHLPFHLSTPFDASQNLVLELPETVGAFCHAAASFDGHCPLDIVSEDASALALVLVASLTAFWNKSVRLVRVFCETASSQLTPHSGGKEQSSGSASVCVGVCAQGSRSRGLGVATNACPKNHDHANEWTHGRKARRRAHVCRSHSHTTCTVGVMCGASDWKTFPRGLDDGVRLRLWTARLVRVLRKKGLGSFATSPPTKWRIQSDEAGTSNSSRRVHSSTRRAATAAC